MTCAGLFLLAGVLAAGPEPAPKGAGRGSADSASAQEAPEARWRQLSAQRQKQLERVFRHFKDRLPEKDWNRYQRLQQTRQLPHLEGLPSHWRTFVVRYARWAREELARLPKAEQERIERLPPDQKAAAIKKALRPLFQKRISECRKAAQQVFTPLELKVLRQLPPRERGKVLRQSGEDAFGLISPWSWRRYQQLGPSKRLVLDYLNMPEAMAGAGPGKTPREEPRKGAEAPEGGARPPTAVPRSSTTKGP